MRMLRTCIYVQISENIVTKTCLREHTLYSSPNQLGRSLFKDLLRRCESLSTRITCVMNINAICHLVALEGYLLGIDDDDVVTAVNVRSVSRLGLATEDKSDAGCKTTKCQIGSINDNPLFVYCRLVKRYSFVALCVHCLDL